MAKDCCCTKEHPFHADDARRVPRSDRFVECVRPLKHVTHVCDARRVPTASKFDGVQLPGGVSLRGSEIMSEAREEIQRIEEKFSLEYEEPIDFMTG